jgi:hypothetical protein
MSRLLFAIALGLGMQAATADASALPQASSATTVSAAGVVQAALTPPEKEAKGGQPGKPLPAMNASLKHDDGKGADDDDGRHPTTGAMLLAALMLMTGIALRRWGAGQQ